MDTKVFDLICDGIGNKTRCFFRGYDSWKQMEDYVRACGVEQPRWLMMMIIATARNLLDAELEAQAAIGADLKAELKADD